MIPHLIRGVVLLVFFVVIPPVFAEAQSPEELEMLRLQNASEEAMANNDPSGAALFSGRAALMASQLAARQPGARERALFVGCEGVFRAQERVYRALALFKLAGGTPPASAGVCGLLDQGAAMAKTVVRNLREQIRTEGLEPGWHVRIRQIEAQADDLVKNAQAVQMDVQCP
jgi:hypothetical protein